MRALREVGRWFRSETYARHMRMKLAWLPEVLLVAAVVCVAYAPSRSGSALSRQSTASPTVLPAGSVAPPVSCPTCWRPTTSSSWQVQFSGGLDLSVNADMFLVDTFDTPASVVQQLHALGHKAICYIDAGTWERWRPDSAKYPTNLLGNANGWSGERWLDIRDVSALAPVIEARLRLCKSKGFDGVLFDNVNGYTNNTGFPLTYQDQLRFNTFLANAAHSLQLSVGLLNDFDQTSALEPYFDWAQVEQCFWYKECNLLQPFISAGKAVLAIEYDLQPQQYCPQARAMRITAIRKHRNLDAYRVPCP